MSDKYDITHTETKDDIISELKDRLSKTIEENTRLRIILDDYAIDINEGKYISQEELICKQEVDRLMEISSTVGLEDDDIKNLEIITKVLDRIKNGNKKKATKKGKKTDIGKLLSIASEE